MGKQSKAKVAAVQAQPDTTEAQVAPEATTAEAKAKPVRYASKSVVNPTARITFVAPNNKKGKSRERFALYQEGMTVGEYVAAVKERNWRYGREDIRWDVQHELIKLEAAE
jgi:hypothetical protein